MKLCWVKSEEFITLEKYILCFAGFVLCFGGYMILSEYERIHKIKKVKNEEYDV